MTNGGGYPRDAIKNCSQLLQVVMRPFFVVFGQFVHLYRRGSVRLESFLKTDISGSNNLCCQQLNKPNNSTPILPPKI